MSVVEKPMRQIRGRLKSASAKLRGSTQFPGESPRLLRHKMEALRKRAHRRRSVAESALPAAPETASGEASVVATVVAGVTSAAFEREANLADRQAETADNVACSSAIESTPAGNAAREATPPQVPDAQDDSHAAVSDDPTVFDDAPPLRIPAPEAEIIAADDETNPPKPLHPSQDKEADGIAAFPLQLILAPAVEDNALATPDDAPAPTELETSDGDDAEDSAAASIEPTFAPKTSASQDAPASRDVTLDEQQQSSQ
jgi:hypothetical protein